MSLCAKEVAEAAQKKGTFPCSIDGCRAVYGRKPDGRVQNIMRSAGHTCLREEEREAQEEAARRMENDPH